MKKILLSFSAFVLVLGVSTPALAHAAKPEDIKAKREAAQARALERRESREERIAEIKQKVEDRKLAVMEEKCARFEARLEDAIPRLSNSANRVKGNLDKVYERVQGFYEIGQLTVNNYEEQVEAIEEAKANAETALEALAEYEFEVDCENQKVGEQLDGFRTSVKDARAEVKAYHKALVGLVSSMRAAAAEEKNGDHEHDESEGSDDHSDETETESETETETETETEQENETETPGEETTNEQ